MKKVLLIDMCFGLVHGSEAQDPQQHFEIESFRRLLSKQETIEALTGGMSEDEKGAVIKAVAEVGPSKWIPEFIKIINELSVGMDELNKAHIINVVPKVDSSRWSQFVEICNTLSEGMDAFSKSCTIEAVADVDSAKWPQFIEITNAFSEGLSGFIMACVIESVANVVQSKWTPEFIQTVNALSSGMDRINKGLVVIAVAKIGPAKWTPEFIQTVNALSSGMNYLSKSFLIEAVADMQPEWYSPFFEYETQTNFFRVVPPHIFQGWLQTASEANNLNTPEQFQAIVNRLLTDYAAQGALPGVAFEIHNYVHASVVTDKGAKQQLEAAVLSKVNELIKNPLDYDTSKALVTECTGFQERI